MMSEFGVTGTPPARLTVGLVSAGRVGTAIGAALERRGHVVSTLVARSGRSRDLAARRLPEARPTDPVGVAESCELLILAVPDAALPGVVADLAAADAFRPGHIVVHVAGAVGADVLGPAAAAGAVVVAAHPAMTFTGGESDVERMEGCSWALTSPDDVGLVVGQMLVMETGGLPVVVAESHRALYHAALAHGANHLVTLVNDAAEALAASFSVAPGGGVEGDPDGMLGTDAEVLARRTLAPLLRAALDNVLASGDSALTGPVMRGDAVTVSRHLDALEDVDGGIATGYRALALRTADRCGAGRDVTDLLAPDLTEQLR
jgi:predicted short-subunit dehydrogenase-like oxidoreductase (DUF2520 family)